jgi:hypothetical protein
MVRIRLAVKFIFFFAGTFLHELAHYLFALLLGKAEGFSVLPGIEGDRFVFGSVKSRARYKVFTSFIATAPLIWWAVLLLLMVHFRLLIMRGGGMPKVDFSLLLRKGRSFSRVDILFIWLFLQMLWAGRLSVMDIKNAAKGFLSVSGVVFLAAIAALVYLSKTFL